MFPLENTATGRRGDDGDRWGCVGDPDLAVWRSGIQAAQLSRPRQRAEQHTYLYENARPHRTTPVALAYTLTRLPYSTRRPDRLSDPHAGTTLAHSCTDAD